MDFKTSLVEDSRIALITDEIDYAVVKGAQTNTPSRYNAIAPSTTSLIYNIAVPSLETLIDRRVLAGTTFTIRCTRAISPPSINGDYELHS